MAPSPSPPAQATSARASSDAAETVSLAIDVRLCPDQPHLLGVPLLDGCVPVAGAVDRQLADPAVGDPAVDQLTAVPLLALGVPSLLELDEEASRGAVEGLDADRPTEGVVGLADGVDVVGPLRRAPPLRERQVAEDVVGEQPVGTDAGLQPADELVGQVLQAALEPEGGGHGGHASDPAIASMF